MMRLTPRGMLRAFATATRQVGARVSPAVSRPVLFKRAGAVLRPPVRGFSSGGLPPHMVHGLPALSPTMEQGNLAEWLVKEGDSFSPGEVLARIETDKATVDLEAQDDGIVAKILVPAGTDGIAIGTDIMVVVEDEDDVGAFTDFTPGSAAPAASATPAAAPAAPATPAASQASATPAR